MYHPVICVFFHSLPIQVLAVRDEGAGGREGLVGRDLKCKDFIFNFCYKISSLYLSTIWHLFDGERDAHLAGAGGDGLADALPVPRL